MTDKSMDKKEPGGDRDPKSDAGATKPASAPVPVRPMPAAAHIGGFRKVIPGGI